MKNGKVHDEYCPICEYELQQCQCIYGGPAHPDRGRRRDIVLHHLDMLSVKQIGHIVALEAYWRISYGDPEDEKEYQEFVKFIEEQEGER